MLSLAAIAGTVFLYLQTKKLDISQKPITQITNSSPVPKGKVTIYLKINPSAKLGDVLTTNIVLGNTKIPKKGAHLFIKYDPKVLQVQDKVASQSGVQIAVYSKFSQFDLIKKRDADNTKGVVDIDMVNRDSNKIMESDYFATINFKPVGRGQTKIYIDKDLSTIYFLKPDLNPEISYKDAIVNIQ